MSNTAYALTAFVAWALFLLVLMEAIRTYLVATKKVAANGFAPDNSGLSPFMQRLARAHANCIEVTANFRRANGDCCHDFSYLSHRFFGTLAASRSDRAVDNSSDFC